MTKRKLVFVTNNRHKLREIREIMPASIEILSLADINCMAEIPETADTLEGNALIKAHYVYDRFGMDCPVSIRPVMPEKHTIRRQTCRSFCMRCKENQIARQGSVQ